MDDESVLKSVKRDHLRRAIKYQTKYKLDSMCGNGVDRHLFGLYAAGKMVGKVPQVFTMPVSFYQISFFFNLSILNIVTKSYLIIFCNFTYNCYFQTRFIFS